MSVFDLFRRALGYSKDSRQPTWDDDPSSRSPFSEYGDVYDHHNEQPKNFGFNVFRSDMSDMENILEQLLGEMASSIDNFGSDFFEVPHDPNDYLKENSENSSSPRDFYLKPSFEKKLEGSKRYDDDIDTKVGSSNILDLFEDSSRPKLPIDVNPYGPSQDSRNSFRMFGKTMSSSTITRSDGVVEHRSTVSTSDGKEKTTITRQIGDQKHTMTTILDKNGAIEKHEDFTNMDEANLPEFEQKWAKSEQKSPNLNLHAKHLVIPTPDWEKPITKLFQDWFK